MQNTVQRYEKKSEYANNRLFLGIQPDDFKRDKKTTHKSNDYLLWLTLVITVKRRQKDGKRTAKGNGKKQ